MSFSPDEFLAEPATQGAEFNPDEFLSQDSSPRIGNNWGRLLGGLDGMDDRLNPEERQTFQTLDAVSGNPKQARAQAITQAWIQEKHPEISHASMELNWPIIRTAYARQEFGMLEPDVTDVALYGAISKRQKDADLAEAQAEVDEGFNSTWTWKDEAKSDLRMTAKKLESFWESINKPAWELPRAPDNLPDMGSFGWQNPALAGAVYNGLAPLFESAVGSPLGIATLGLVGVPGSAGPLVEAAKTNPLAKVALMGMEGGFAALMGYGTYKGAKRLPAVFNDPAATFQDKATAATEVVASGAATLLGTLGLGLTAFEGKKAAQIVKKMDGKNPKEMADILRKEAEGLETPAEQKPVLAAADALDKLAPIEKTKEGAAVTDAAKAEAEAQKQGTVLALENGGYVVMDAQGKLIDYAETAAEAKAISERGMHHEQARLEEPEAPASQSVDTVPEEKTIGISNEAVNRELAAMGENPLTPAEHIKQVEDMKAAIKTLGETPEAGTKLLEELRAKPRPLTSDEGAIMLAEMKRLSDERSALQADRSVAEQLGDVPEIERLDTKAKTVQSQFNEWAKISKEVGTLGGRGQAFRNVMIKEDYSLASLESKMQEANKGEELSPEQKAEVGDLSKRLDAAEKKLTDYLKTRESAKPRQPSKVSRTLSEHADEARARISARLEKMTSLSAVEGPEGVKDFFSKENLNDLAVVGADYLAKGVKDLAQWSEAMVKEFGERIKPHLESLFEESKKAASDEKRLGAFKTRTEKRITELKKKLATGDLESAPKREPIHMDEEANRLLAERERVKLEIDKMIEAKRLSNRTAYEKAADTAVKWRRGFLLSSPTTLAKLTSAAAQRLTFTPIEELVGAAIGKIIPDIAAKAPREGGLSIEAESRAITDAFTKGMSDAAAELKTGAGNLDVLFENKRKTVLRNADRSVVDFFGHLHAALKSPVKRAEFARSFQKRAEYYAAHGVDISDPMVQAKISVEAYKDAKRSIFMQDNVVTDAFNRALRALEQKDPKTGEFSLGGKTAATVARVLLPIVKVPTNIVAETGTYIGGVPIGATRAARAFFRGIENLPPHEAELIMRNLKKGSLGAAAVALGYFSPDLVGGYYQPGEKRLESDVPVGSIKVGDATIPSFLLHSPLMETMQFGATIRRVQDHKVKGQAEGADAGMWAATLGLIEQVPFARETVEMAKLLDPSESGYALGELAKSMMIPAVVDWIARNTDTDEHGEKIKRKPKTVIEHIETGIPGLRQNVKSKGAATTTR